ncbi:hypothetical protein PIROE2DRAFT_18182, partial [Piromyces sp. E2]
IGSRILSHLNPFFKLTYEKSAQKFEKRWGRNWFIIGNDSTYPKELLHNQSSANNDNQVNGSANSINNSNNNPSISNSNINSNPNINSASNRNSGIFSSSNSIFSPERRPSFNTINDDVSSVALDSSSKPFSMSSPRLNNQRKPSNPLSMKILADNYSLPVPPRQVESNNIIKIKVKTKNADDGNSMYSPKKNITSPDSGSQSPYSLSSPNIGNHSIKSSGNTPISTSSISRSRSNSNKNIIKSSNSISKSSSISRSRSISRSDSRTDSHIDSHTDSRIDSRSNSRSRSRSRSNSQSKSYDHDIISSTSESDIESDLISKDDLDDEEVLKNINQHIQGNDVPYCDILEDDLINLYNANTSKEVSEDSRNFGDISMNLHKLTVKTDHQEFDQSMDQSKSMMSSQPDLDDNQLFSSRIKSPELDTSFLKPGLENSSFVRQGLDNSFVRQVVDTSLLSNTTPNPTNKPKPNNGLVFNQRSDSFNHPYGDSEDLSKNILFSSSASRKKEYKNRKVVATDPMVVTDDEEYIEGYSRAYSNEKYSNSRGTIENTYLDETFSSFNTTSLSLSTTSSFSTAAAKGKENGGGSTVGSNSNKEQESTSATTTATNPDASKLGIHHFGQYGNQSGVQSNLGELSTSHLIPDYEAKVEGEQLVIPKIDVPAAKSTNPIIQKLLQKQQLSIDSFNKQ